MADLRTLIAHFQEIVQKADDVHPSCYPSVTTKMCDRASRNLFAALLGVAEAAGKCAGIDGYGAPVWMAPPSDLLKAIFRLREAMEANRG